MKALKPIMKIIIAFLGVCVVLFGLLMLALNAEKIYDFKVSIFGSANVDTSLYEKAVEQRNPRICMKLQKSVFYAAESNGYTGETTSLGTYSPRYKCLTNYYHETHDVGACELLGTFGENRKGQQQTCVVKVAELSGDISICEQIPKRKNQIHADAILHCKAKASQDYAYCFEIERGGVDGRKDYSPYTVGCIADVAGPPGEVLNACLGVDFDDPEWKAKRHDCIGEIVQDLTDPKEIALHCEYMYVTEMHAEPADFTREDCHNLVKELNK